MTQLPDPLDRTIEEIQKFLERLTAAEDGVVLVDSAIVKQVAKTLAEELGRVTICIHPYIGGAFGYFVERPRPMFRLARSLTSAEVAGLRDSSVIVIVVGWKESALDESLRVLIQIELSRRSIWIPMATIAAVGTVSFGTTLDTNVAEKAASASITIASVYLAVFGIYSGLAHSHSEAGNTNSTAIGTNIQSDRLLLSWTLASLFISVIALLLAWTTASNPWLSATLTIAAQFLALVGLLLIVPPVADVIPFFVGRHALMLASRNLNRRREEDIERETIARSPSPSKVPPVVSNDQSVPPTSLEPRTSEPKAISAENTTAKEEGRPKAADSPSRRRAKG